MQDFGGAVGLLLTRWKEYILISLGGSVLKIKWWKTAYKTLRCSLTTPNFITFQWQKMGEPFTFVPHSYIFTIFHAFAVSRMNKSKAWQHNSDWLPAQGQKSDLSEMILSPLVLTSNSNLNVLIFLKVNSTCDGGRETYFSSRFCFPLWSYWIFSFHIFSSCKTMYKT